MKIDWNAELCDAADAGDRDRALRALEEGASVDYRSSGHESTPLWYAAGRGHAEVVELLIQYGADPRDYSGFSQSTVLEHAQFEAERRPESVGHQEALALLRAAVGDSPPDSDRRSGSARLRDLRRGLELRLEPRNSDAFKELVSLFNEYEDAILYMRETELSELARRLESHDRGVAYLLLKVLDDGVDHILRGRIARFLIVSLKNRSAADTLFDLFVRGKDPAELDRRRNSSEEDQGADEMYHMIRKSLEEAGYSLG